MATKWCEIQILKNGRLDWPYEYAEVCGKTSGFMGGFTEDVRTDDEGKAIIEWVGGDHLEKIYCEGQTFEGPFENGRFYRRSYRV